MLPDLLRFASWVGGDMDGNPNVNAKTIRETLARQRSLILEPVLQRMRALSTKLSQSTKRDHGQPGGAGRIEEYRHMFQNAYHAVPGRHRDMPYRVLLWLIQQRLQSTFDDDIYPYEDVHELRADIAIIADSLRAHRGEHAPLFAVDRLMRRIDTLASTSSRSTSARMRWCIGRSSVSCLGEDDLARAGSANTGEKIIEAIESRRPAAGPQHAGAQDDCVCSRPSASAAASTGKAIGPFIISMTKGADDVLSVLLLAELGRAAHQRGHVPLDIAPLLETVDDLDNGAGDPRTPLSSDFCIASTWRLATTSRWS